MKRDEAIKRLEDLKEYYDVFKDCGTDEEQAKDMTAFNMAIKALEQEPCEDCISRQAVDDAIYDYSRACDVDYAQIMEYIDKLPSVTPKAKINVLDKIRAEIEELDEYYDNDYFSGNRDAMFKCNDVLQIIDKYKAESEDKE